jgi:hypothetical protein
MAYNDFNINRVAFGNVTFPTNTSANTASTLSVGVDAWIPKGAIVTAIKYHPGGAITNGSNFVDATINVYAGAEACGTNNRKASEALLAGSCLTHAPVAASGGVMSAGGQLAVHFASSNSKRTGIAFDTDVYVEYLYNAAGDAV